MITRIAHVCIKTRNLARTVDFYTRGLGAEPVFRFTKQGAIGGVYLRLADRTFLEFFEEPEREPAASDPSLHHFCLESDDIEADRQRFEDAGLEPGPIERGCDRSFQFWVTDPNGVCFEFHHYTPESAQFVGGDCEMTW